MKRKTASQRYSQAGVSLVELMMGLTVGLIITAGAFTVLFSNQKLILEKDVMDRSQENFRFASTTITRLVRQATSFGIPENNNELVVYFDSTQRDCLGEPNHSSVNTFKLNTDNELLCELVLNDGTTQTVKLAKNVSGLKFAYGIQNGAAYQPYFANSTTNTAVRDVWGTITSVLSKISIDDGSAKQPTIDFVATSHLRAMTQLASTGGTSLVNPPSTNAPVVTDPVVTDPVVTDPVVTDPVVKDPEQPQTKCLDTMLDNINLSFFNGSSDGTWKSIFNTSSVTSPYKAKKDKNMTVTVKAGTDTTGWTISRDAAAAVDLKHNPIPYTLPKSSGLPMSLTIHCDASKTSVTTDVDISSTIHFISE